MDPPSHAIPAVLGAEKNRAFLACASDITANEAQSATRALFFFPPSNARFQLILWVPKMGLRCHTSPFPGEEYLPDPETSEIFSPSSYECPFLHLLPDPAWGPPPRRRDRTPVEPRVRGRISVRHHDRPQSCICTRRHFGRGLRAECQVFAFPPVPSSLLSC